MTHDKNDSASGGIAALPHTSEFCGHGNNCRSHDTCQDDKVCNTHTAFASHMSSGGIRAIDFGSGHFGAFST